MRLYRRQMVAYVDDVAIEHLRMTFKVERTIKKHPNSCELKIYGMAPQTRARFGPQPTVEIAAGYDGVLQRLFHGQAKSTLAGDEGPESVFTLQCGDGYKSFGFGHTNQTFPPGAKTTDVLLGLAKQTGLSIGNAITAFQKGGVDAALQSFTHGFTTSGNGQQDIDGIMTSAGFTWSIQDGEIQVLTSDTDATSQVDVLAGDTGLVGSPELGRNCVGKKPASLKVKCLLRGQYKPGVKFQLESEALHGQFRVDEAVHEGDTWGGDWFTSLAARPL